MSSDENDDRKDFLHQRERYADSKNQQSDQFDRYMLLLSSGSFGVTFSFIKSIVSGSFFLHEFLIFGWAMFSYSIISTLISFLLSQVAYSKSIEKYDLCYKNGSEYIEPAASFWVSVLNYYSLSFFIIGVLSILFFISQNL